MKLLSQGNTKTGKGVSLFNLPRKITCPCMSKVCEKVCYTQWYVKAYPSILDSYIKRLKATKSDGFVDAMNKELKNGISIVRWHASGDFYSKEYIAKWIEIVTNNPKIIFYGYTRSWNDKEMLPQLECLAALPNVQLWWSCDNSMPEPPEGKKAYLSTNDEDPPTFKVDLVFRVNRKTIRHDLGGGMVCPHETGEFSIKDNPLKCLTCKICFLIAKEAI